MLMVRPMTKRDVQRVYEIEVQSFRSPWSKLSLLGELHNNVAHYYVAEEEGRVVGYGGMWLLFDEAHITNIAIAPEQRGRHFGRYLLYGMMEAAHGRGAERMTLEVRETNATAQSLYYSFDFEKEGYRKRYYEDTGEGAYLLWNEDLGATLEKNACLKDKFVLQYTKPLRKEKHMSLYSDWKARAEDLQSDAAYQQYWKDYFAQETEVYKQVLESHDTPLTGTVKALAEQVGMDPVAFVGYLDGANTSFADGEKDLDALTEDSEVTLTFDFEKLFFNMHEAKADWLYTLPQWDGVLSPEKRHEITKAYRASKIFVAPVQVGRNDPCPCGSGKKYKNCCGKNK